MSRQSLSPNSSYAQRSTSSACIDSTSGSCRLGIAKQYLLERVAAQPEPQRLERDDFLRWDVPEVHVRPEVLDEPRLRLLRRRLGDHLERARVELLLDPLHPLVRREDDVGVLRPDLGEDGEVAREIGDQLEFAVARDVDRPVGDLDVREAMLDEPALELVEALAREDDLEQRAAAHDRRLERAIEGDLLLEVVRDVARAPAELDDVDELAAGIEHPLDLAQVQALVDDVRQPFAARLAGTLGEVKEAVVKAGHTAPSASPARAPARRGRASCRARRCRR